ncbi:hypothetical protein OG21DRAFT_1510726 [Imleria badia]|nr:hypothetical protein OG21DRAFT_1510726 [Imleria badia]
MRQPLAWRCGFHVNQSSTWHVLLILIAANQLIPRGGLSETITNAIPMLPRQPLANAFHPPSDPRPMSERRFAKRACVVHMWPTSMIVCGTHDSDMTCHARTYSNWQD